MKFLKKFEQYDDKFNGTLKIGDWVFLTHWWVGQHLHYFIDTHPAKITKIKPLSINTTTYYAEYLFNPLNDNEYYDSKWTKEFNASSGFQPIGEWVTRKAFTKEIEKELMLKDVDKYNL